MTSSQGLQTVMTVSSRRAVCLKVGMDEMEVRIVLWQAREMRLVQARTIAISILPDDIVHRCWTYEAAPGYLCRRFAKEIMALLEKRWTGT